MKPQLGQAVIWTDASGNDFPALITAVWSETCINVVFVSGDEKRRDDYGRQVERATSCQHVSESNVHGFYWRFEGEEKNSYVPPQQS